MSESPWRLGPRPRIFPRERLFGFRYRVFGRHLDAAVGLEPRLEGMNLVSYLLLHHCDINKAGLLHFMYPKHTLISFAVSAFSCINIISKFSKKVKFSGRSGEN